MTSRHPPRLCAASIRSSLESRTVVGRARAQVRLHSARSRRIPRHRDPRPPRRRSPCARLSTIKASDPLRRDREDLAPPTRDHARRRSPSRRGHALFAAAERLHQGGHSHHGGDGRPRPRSARTSTSRRSSRDDRVDLRRRDLRRLPPRCIPKPFRTTTSASCNRRNSPETSTQCSSSSPTTWLATLDARCKFKGAMIYPGIVLACPSSSSSCSPSSLCRDSEVSSSHSNAKLPLVTRMLLAITGFLSDALVGFRVVVFGARGDVPVLMRRTKEGRARLDTRHPEDSRRRGSGSDGHHRADVSGPRVDDRDGRAPARGHVGGGGLRQQRGVPRRHRPRPRTDDGGKGLAEPLPDTGLFPAPPPHVPVGRGNGTLDQQMETAADFYYRELDIKITNFTAPF